MRHIIFVGDKPSKKNISQSVPFVGTQSYKVLLDWIWRMDIDITSVIMTNRDSLYTCGGTSMGSIFRTHTFIALGSAASEELDKLNISHFKLPHPSPKNRKLNDKFFVTSQLNLCRIWLDKLGWL